MKKLNSLFVMLLLAATTAFAQFPQAINFQAIARDGNGDVMVATPIQIRLTVLDGSATGTEVYQELRALTTNDYGSFSFQIGRNANYVTIGSFGAIDWNTGAKYLKIDYDPTNQFNWSLSLGTIEFVSVPYALSAENVTFIDATGAQDGDVLVYNATSGKFEPGSVNATEIDPIFNVSAAKNITTSNISNWNTAFGWGNHATAGYLTTEVDGSVTNEIELPTQNGNSGKVLSTNGTAASWTAVADNSATNEIQTLSLNTNTLSLSNGGGSVTLPTSNLNYSNYSQNFWDYSTLRNEWITSSCQVTAPSNGYYLVSANGRAILTELDEWCKFRIYNNTSNNPLITCFIGINNINSPSITLNYFDDISSISTIQFLSAGDIISVDYFIGGTGSSEFVIGGDENGDVNLTIVKISN